MDGKSANLHSDKKSIANIAGFTLIELIIVIVILGILAVVAAPRFIAVSSDARAASLQVLAGALSNGADLVFAKSVIAGTHNLQNSSVMINGVEVETVFGYPQSSIINSIFSTDYIAWIDISASMYSTANSDKNWQITDDVGSAGISLGTSNNGVGIGFVLEAYKSQTGSQENISFCGVSYFQPSSAGEKPAISVFDSQC